MHCWGVRIVQQPEPLALTLDEGAALYTTAFLPRRATSQGVDLRVVQLPEPRSHWHWSWSNCPPTRDNRSATRLRTRNCLEPGYKSLITPPLHESGWYIHAIYILYLRHIHRESSKAE